MTTPLASLCVLVLTSGTLVFTLARIGAHNARAADRGARARWLGGWLPLALAAPLMVVAFDAPRLAPGSRFAPNSAFDALWPVFAMPAIACALAVFSLGARSPRPHTTPSPDGAQSPLPAHSATAWGVGLLVGALACLISAAGRVGYFEGQIMLTAGVILLWMRLLEGDALSAQTHAERTNADDARRAARSAARLAGLCSGASGTSRSRASSTPSSTRVGSV